MPRMPPSACLEPRCPRPAVANGRGRCEEHRRTNAERGYPRHVWEAASRAQRRRVPYCERCGARTDLVADHIRNGDPRALQTLCRRCNTAKRNRETAATGGDSRQRVARLGLRTRAPICTPTTGREGHHRGDHRQRIEATQAAYLGHYSSPVSKRNHGLTESAKPATAGTWGRRPFAAQEPAPSDPRPREADT